MKKSTTDSRVIGNSRDLGIARDPCIVWLTSPSGAVEPLCTIARDEFYATYVRAAETFYKASKRGDGVVSFEINHTAGLAVPAWRDISSGHTNSFLATLAERRVSAEIRQLIRDSLDIENSCVNFQKLAAERFGALPIHAEIVRAHDILSVAHANDSLAHPQDTDGLFHIPYMQHTRNIAIQAMELNLTGRAVIVALLHDVVEGNNRAQECTLESLKMSFDREIFDRVIQLTKAPGQARADFLSHVGTLSGELALVKALGRYYDLVRAFARQAAELHARMLNECSTIYDQIFEREAALTPLRRNYELLKQGLENYQRSQ